MQKSMRFSSKLLEDDLSNAKVQFISGYIDTFYQIAPDEMHFCISIALKWQIVKNQMHLCI